MLNTILLQLILLTSFGNLISCNDFENDTKKLIKAALIFDDPNPIHYPATQAAYTEFVDLLRFFDNRINQQDSNAHHYFEQIIENASQFFDDSLDQRRMNYRRAMYFASLALSSEYEKGITFLEYAKFSLTGSFENPDLSLQENKMLGLMLLELLMTYQTAEDSGRIDFMVNRIEQFMNENSTYLNKEISNSTIELLQYLE